MIRVMVRVKVRVKVRVRFRVRDKGYHHTKLCPHRTSQRVERVHMA